MVGNNIRKTEWYKCLMVLVLVGLLWPAVAYQAFVPCSPYGFFDSSPGGGWSIADECTFNDLLETPVRVFNWALSLAGMVFLGVVVWGGVRMMLFYASDSPDTELNDAKMTIRRGIVGLVIIAFSYTVVHILLYTIFDLSSSAGVVEFLKRFGLGI